MNTPIIMTLIIAAMVVIVIIALLVSSLAMESKGKATAGYPYPDGDYTVLGPEIFASKDGTVICWKGENYVRQQEQP